MGRALAFCAFFGVLTLACEPAATPCTESAACDDGVACTDDVCVASACVHRPDSAVCGAGEVCEESGCVLGRACATGADCSDDDPCTTGETCVPSTRTCVHAVLDGDGDGDPPRVCGGTDCDDANADASGGAVEICDGADNDCDGAVDAPLRAPIEICGSSCVDTSSASAHCGACGNACDASEVCRASACVERPGAVVGELAMDADALPLVVRAPGGGFVVAAGTVTSIGGTELPSPSLVVLRLDARLGELERVVFPCTTTCSTVGWVDVTGSGAVNVVLWANEAIADPIAIPAGDEVVVRLDDTLAPIAVEPATGVLYLHTQDGVEEIVGVGQPGAQTLCGQAVDFTERNVFICRAGELVTWRPLPSGARIPYITDALPGGAAVGSTSDGRLVIWDEGLFWEDAIDVGFRLADVSASADGDALVPGSMLTATGPGWGPLDLEGGADAYVLRYDASAPETPPTVWHHRTPEGEVAYIASGGAGGAFAVIVGVDGVEETRYELWSVDATGDVVWRVPIEDDVAIRAGTTTVVSYRNVGTATLTARTL